MSATIGDPGDHSGATPLAGPSPAGSREPTAPEVAESSVSEPADSRWSDLSPLATPQRWSGPLRNDDDYEELFREERLRVLAFIRGEAPSWDAATVQDVAMNAWASVLARLGKINRLGEIQNVRAYLYQTVRNKITDEYRDRAHSTPVDEASLVRAAGATADDPADLVENRETALTDFHRLHRDAREILEALWQLPERQRTAYRLSVARGFTAAEIADVLGCTPGAVYNLVNRAREKLVERFGDERLKWFEAGDWRWPE
jgi:RNA polymerase sigma factor (sigma-70 family)